MKTVLNSEIRLNIQRVSESKPCVVLANPALGKCST